MTRPSYLLIANPVAGHGSGAARAEALRSRLAQDHEVELVLTSRRGDATDLARGSGGRHDRVIAIGGDGTLNEVLSGLMPLGSSAETRPSLGYLPGGTANVATAAFGFAPDPAQLARELPTVTGRAVDVGVAEVEGRRRPFLLWCGAGVDAVVISELNTGRTGPMGRWRLLANALRVMRAVARYPAPGIRVSVDGSDGASTSSVLLANVPEIAFGGTVHPGASPFDGRLDVVTIPDPSLAGVIAAGTRMLLSSLTAAGGVEHGTAETVHLTSSGRVPVQIDGEPVGHLPASCRLEKGAIRLLVTGREAGALP